MKKNFDVFEKNSSKVYIEILVCWFLTEILFGIPFLYSSIHRDLFNNIIIIFSFILISYFWLNGLKDVFFVLNYNLLYKNKIKHEYFIQHNYKFDCNPKVLLVYTTCDDFISDSLSKSMSQSYKNIKTYILDDSRSSYYKTMINKFVDSHDNIEVIRRDNHTGFKAGNINNFLCNYDDYDYFVLLDSDEIIPKYFVKKSLSFFKYKKRLGILQCNHISTRNYNKFMQMYYRGVNAHWPTYQLVKQNYGFLSMLGHGAMISKACFRDVGKFPECVAEDISFTIEAHMKNWITDFAITIKCEEQFPVDYLAFKKRLFKWTGGNLEFMRNYSKDIFTNHTFSWFERLDLILFTFSLPLTYIFSLFIIITLVVLPIRNTELNFSVSTLVPTIVCFLSPAFNDMIYDSSIKKLSIWKKLEYNIYSLLLYGSMYFTSLSSSFLFFWFKNPQFIVTPKDDKNYTFLQALYYNRGDLIFGLLLSFISIIFTKSLAPISLIVWPILFEPILTLKSNKR